MVRTSCIGSWQWHKGGAAPSFFMKFTQFVRVRSIWRFLRRKCKTIRIGCCACISYDRLGVAFFASNSVNRLNPTIFGINSSQLGSYLASRESVVGAASECNSLVAHVRTTCL